MGIWDDIVGTAEDAWDAGTEWVDTNVVEPVKEKAVEIATDIKLNQIKNEVIDSFKGAVVSHDKLTPELIEQGWKLGLDNVPYNASLHGIHDPGGIYYDPDREDNIAAANAVLSYAGGLLVDLESRQKLAYGKQDSVLNPRFIAISPYINSIEVLKLVEEFNKTLL